MLLTTIIKAEFPQLSDRFCAKLSKYTDRKYEVLEEGNLVVTHCADTVPQVLLAERWITLALKVERVEERVKTRVFAKIITPYTVDHMAQVCARV